MRRGIVLAAMCTVFAAAPILGAAQSTTVTLSVPPVQLLEGSTQHALRPGSPQSGQLTVKSNMPWSLRVDVTGTATASWRPTGTTAWTALPRQGVVRTGGGGMHHLGYEIHAPAPLIVRFTLAP